MTLSTAISKNVAFAALLTFCGMVATLGCQTAQEKAEADVPKTAPPTTATAPPTRPPTGASYGTATPTPTPTPTSEWPKMVTIPAGTTLIVALQSRISTEFNKAGETFRTNLAEAVRVDQMTVLPAGTEVRGQLTLSEPPHRTTGKAQLTLAVQDVIDPAGDVRSISALPIVLVAEGDKITDEEKVASGAVIGGIIGALTSSKQRAKGAVVGAAAGAVAGGAVALATKGHQLDLPAGQRFEFELDQSMTLPVTRQTAQLYGNAPTPNYAALHPAGQTTLPATTTTTSPNQYATTVADRAADAAARKRAAEALAAQSEWPKVVTVPAGITLIMALQTHLRTDSNTTGDAFSAQLTEAVRVDQMTVFPIGTEVRGHLTVVEEPHRTAGKAQLTLAFTDIVDPAGFLHALSTTPIVLVGKGDKVSDEAKVGAGAVIGGIIGALSSSKQRTKGAAVGAAAGAVAGGAIALAGKGEQLDLPAGQRFSVELNELLRVSVTELTASR